jgi:hypothetical protein
MKKRTFTLLLILLQFVSVNLHAQNPEGLFRLKEGDWFEMQLNNSLNFNRDKSSQFFNSILQTPLSTHKNADFHLNCRYQLSKQLLNGNQLYNVTVERIKVKMLCSPFGTWLGYDSFYPPYKESISSIPKKLQFIMEVTPNGDIVRFDPNLDNPDNELKLAEISPKLKNSFSISFDLKLLSPEFVKKLSSFITMFSMHKEGINVVNNNRFDSKPFKETETLKIAKVIINDSLSCKIHFLKKSGIPLVIKMDNAQAGSDLLLTRASFPIPGNTIVKGLMKDQPNKKILIHFIDFNPLSSSNEYHFKTGPDGSFLCPIFLIHPQHLKISIGKKSLNTFMEPGDTLHISEIGIAQERVGGLGNFYDISDAASNTNSLDFYSGKVAFNTLLSIEMEQWFYYMPMPNDIQALLLYKDKMSKKVNEILIKYFGKASETCISYFRTEAMHFLAADKFYFFDCKKTALYPNPNYKTISFTDYPSDFFAEADTMPILLNSFEWGRYYNGFIHYSQLIKQTRLGLSIGRTPNHSFLENYYFSQASLSGYPFYNRVAKLIDSELRTGITTNEIIEPYYQDFINNCADPALVEPLIKLHDTSVQLKVGNAFPINTFALQDSSIFKLERYRGKPICLILLNGPKQHISFYKEEIEKFRKEEVEFIFAKMPTTYYSNKKEDSTILKKPNVTYIELAEQDLKSKLLLNGTKIFMMDKWFRMMENNAEDPPTHKYQGGPSKFEKSLRKTIETKRYSKAKKTAMLKTAGWSLGSILFTFLIGWWIYRIRIRRLKNQEAAKRRIKELEIKAIRSQMNPHFIFNALNSIQSLINGNQFKGANIYLSKFAVLLRGVLNNSEKSRISLSDELHAVELYCQLEQLRFEFKFGITIDPDVNCDLIEIPGMIIQPLAENAVVHGLSGKGDQGTLDIMVKRQNGSLCICVMDNGIGLPTETTDVLSQKGFGLKLVEERINILNLDGKEAKLTIENRSNTEGTIATLIIPID